MPIAVGIDHAIIAIQDLDAAAAMFRDLLGLQATGGGVHPQFGTANRIIVLDHAYIELLGAAPDSTPHGWIGSLLASGQQGCAGLALETEDAAAAAELLRARGITVAGPTVGHLDAPNGFSRDWDVVRFEDPEASAMPFLIRHRTAGEERRRLLAGPPGVPQHALGVRDITSVTLAVTDLEAALDAYAHAYDLARPVTFAEDSMLAARTAAFLFPSGTTMLLATPRHSGHGAIANALLERGEGLFAITLAVDDLANSVITLRSRGLGVRVDEPDGVLVAAQINHRQLLGIRLGLVGA